VAFRINAVLALLAVQAAALAVELVVDHKDLLATVDVVEEKRAKIQLREGWCSRDTNDMMDADQAMISELRAIS